MNIILVLYILAGSMSGSSAAMMKIGGWSSMTACQEAADTVGRRAEYLSGVCMEVK